VYEHLLPDNQTVFYVGMGRGPRAYGKTSRNPFWRAVVGPNKRPIVRFAQKGLTKEAALALEVRLIEYYGRRDIETGPLVNLSTGGEHAIPGVTAKTNNAKAVRAKWQEPEYRKKCCEAAKRKFQNPEMSQHYSEAQRRRFTDPEQRRKASEANKNNPKVLAAAAKGAEAVRGKEAWNKGQAASEETKAKQAQARRDWYASLTPEQLAAHNAKLAEARAKSKANKPRQYTPEELEARKQAKREYVRN